MNVYQDLLQNRDSNSAANFFDKLCSVFSKKSAKVLDINNLELIDEDVIDEIKSLSLDLSICFGKTLRDLKCSIIDRENLRTHDIFLKYKGYNKITVSSVNLPHSQLQDREYLSIAEVVTAYHNYIQSLSVYLQELENIDNHFTVVEPVKPTFKDDYRRIALDERVWLHIEITTNGFATNVYLIGESEEWNDKLQDRLFSWDHDKEIVENILTIFDSLKTKHSVEEMNKNMDSIENKNLQTLTCGICFCSELPDNLGVPQPLCQNPKCGVYYHKNCLYQWLVTSEGGRVPAFGIANGSCPSCLEPITCSKIDN